MTLAQAFVREPKPEVRRCARCGEAAMTVESAWQHSYSGIKTNSQTLDCRCQACGGTVTLRSKAELNGLRIAGFLLLPTIIPGLFILALCWHRSKQWAHNPVVPDVPMPQIRYRSGPPSRSCARCGGVAVLRSVVRNRTNGIPTGTEYQFRCEQCQGEFTVESAWGLVLMSILGSLFVSATIAIFRHAEEPGTRYGWGGLLALVSLGLVISVVKRISTTVRNPELPAGKLP